MKRKLSILLAVLFCVTMLSAGKNNNVGYDKAEQAGLAFLHTAFGIDATEGKVKRCASFNEVTIDGEKIAHESSTLVNFYHVAVFDPETNYPYYTAEVNAVTGVAYRAEYARRYIQLSAEQQNKAASLGALDSFADFDFSAYKQEAVDAAYRYIQDHFASEDHVLRVIPDEVETNSDIFPMVDVDSFVLMKSGTAYRVKVCWPSLTVTEVYILGENP